MKMRMLLIMSLGMLLAPGVLWSMQESPAPAEQQEAPPDEAMQMRIYTLEYYPVDRLADILFELTVRYDVDIAFDKLSNQLIVTASSDRLQQIERVVSALDTPNARSPQTQQMMYRVFMLELPSKDQNLKPFSLAIESPTQLPAAQFLSAVKDAELQVSTFRQSDELAESGHMVFGIQGRAASNEAVRRMLEKVPDALMKELVWDDEAFSAAIPGAQVTQLPARLQEHIRKFLGEGVQTIGYWFGNLSLPGEVRAPIGPWMLELNVESEQAGELALEISVNRESQIDAQTWKIQELLSNSVRSKVGKPIIIGYNRDRYGMRTMGALVIVPEVDTTPASGSEPKPQ